MLTHMAVWGMRKTADLKDRLRDLRDDNKGVTAMEYGVIAAIMVAVIGTAWGAVATNLGTLMTAIAGKLTLT